MNHKTSLIQPEQIEQVILLIRGQRVMLERDLAPLYGVETKNLNKAVQRNAQRIPVLMVRLANARLMTKRI